MLLFELFRIASDDLFYPGLLELVCRAAWLASQLFLYFQYQSEFQCAAVDLLHIYYIGFLLMMLTIVCVQFFIVYLSTRGTITHVEPRRHMNKFLYVRTLLIFIEIVWSCIGAVWLFKVNWNSCSKFIYVSVLINIAFCSIAFLFLVVVLFVVFDPISHLPENDIINKRKILYAQIKKIFFCCYCCLYTSGDNSEREYYENSYKQISSLLEMIFRGGDMTPSDIAAGILLLGRKENDQFRRELKWSKKLNAAATSTTAIEYAEETAPPKWMNINEAAYYVRYAIATYSWPYYIYMHNMRGVFNLCCSYSSLDSECHCCCIDCSCCCMPCCCCCSSSQEQTQAIAIIDSNTGESLQTIRNFDKKYNRHLKAFKHLANIEQCDIVYANFQNELFLSPFCIIVDHFKKTIIITIRGTLSMR
jgi:sn1-specific diacylglycerol lipase